ncbi:MAG: aminoglycoside phosphotransferase family protein [Pseudomonadota bacterium]
MHYQIRKSQPNTTTPPLSAVLACKPEQINCNASDEPISDIWERALPLLAPYHNFFKQSVRSIEEILPGASSRQIFRLTSESSSAIGIINPNRTENDAFVKFAKFFRSIKLGVPEIYQYLPNDHLYIEADLGNVTLANYLAQQREITGDPFPLAAETMYKRSLEQLVRFQSASLYGLDDSYFSPSEPNLLPQVLIHELKLFKDALVTRLLRSFDSSQLVGEFNNLISILQKARSDFFVHRDFQARNIMVKDEDVYLIDFQDGCRGPLQYDVVSLLYQARTRIPSDARERLISHYCDELSKGEVADSDDFRRHLSAFVIARMIQVLGVYGNLGLGKGKQMFIDSIPTALSTLKIELSSNPSIHLPTLRDCVDQLIEITSPKSTTFDA